VKTDIFIDHISGQGKAVGCVCLSPYLQFTFVEQMVELASAVRHCFGWASGRTSGLQKLSDEALPLSVWSKVQIVCIWSS